MKVVLLTFDFPPAIGGVQTYLYEISRRLGKHWDLTVLTTVEAQSTPDLGFKRVQLSASRPSLILRFLQAQGPDKILVGHAHPRLLLPAATSAWGKYATVTYGNDYLAMQNHWHTPLSNRLLAASRPLITISKHNAARLRNLGVNPGAVIPPGTDPAVFYPKASSGSHPPILLTAARLVPRKGIDSVIQILPDLLQDFPNLMYLIAGEGPDRARLEDIIRKYQVNQAVRFLGALPYQEMPAVYRSADIFVMPSREEPRYSSIEGFGIVFLEASASGLPVVAGRSGGTSDAVRDGETGFLIPPDDPQALFAALQRLLSQPGLRHKMGRAGRKFVIQQMNWDRAAEQMRRCLQGTGV